MSDTTEFDFDELIADMLDVSDEKRESGQEEIALALWKAFEIEYHTAYKLTVALLNHTPEVRSALGGNTFKAFVSKSAPVMLMKKKVK